jgi:hypothetical protein
MGPDLRCPNCGYDVSPTASTIQTPTSPTRGTSCSCRRGSGNRVMALEEMLMHKPVWRLKDSSHITRLVTCHDKFPIICWNGTASDLPPDDDNGYSFIFCTFPYLWANKNPFFYLCLTQAGEFLLQI